MNDSFSALGYNPAPGHPRLATNLANHLGSTASTLQETQRLLDGLDKQNSFWTGDAATKFTEQVHDLPDYLKRAEESLRGAKTVLDGWSDSLSGMKKKADGLEADAQEAKTRLQHANEDMATAKADPDLRLAGLSFYSEADLASAQHRLDAAQKRVDGAIERVNLANSDLQKILDEADKLSEKHSDTAQTHADAIRKHAEDHAPGNAWSKISDWWDKHGGDLLSTLSAVVGIAAIFFPVLAPIAIGLSLAAFAVHVNQYAKSGVDMWPPTSKNIGNWATLGGDALGAVPGVGAAVKGVRAGKTAFTAAEGAARVTKGAGTGAKTAWSAARGSTSHFTGAATTTAEKLGATTHAATIGKSTEAVVTGALTAPTGATLFTDNDTVAAVSANATEAGDAIGIGELGWGPVTKIRQLAKAV